MGGRCRRRRAARILAEQTHSGFGRRHKGLRSLSPVLAEQTRWLADQEQKPPRSVPRARRRRKARWILAEQTRFGHEQRRRRSLSPISAEQTRTTRG
jgi:hypothetical protein